MLKDTQDQKVVAVSKSPNHSFSKTRCDSIVLLTGLGVEGDAHKGETVKHRSRVQADPTQPNLRQVHLIHHELLDDLIAQGYRVEPGSMGENITTAGLDLISLPKGASLRIGASVVIEVTGLRNPCKQLDYFQDGLMNAVLERGETGELIRKAGIMGVVAEGGLVATGDQISVDLPEEPHEKLERV